MQEAPALRFAVKLSRSGVNCGRVAGNSGAEPRIRGFGPTKISGVPAIIYHTSGGHRANVSGVPLSYEVSLEATLSQMIVNKSAH